MSKVSASLMDQVIDALDSAGYAALLTGATAIANGLEQLLLCDLHSGRHTQLDPAQDASALLALTADLFGDGDGRALQGSLTPAGNGTQLALLRAAQVLLYRPPHGALALARGTRLDLPRLQAVAAAVDAPLAAGELDAVLQASPLVEAAWRFAPDSPRVLDEIFRPGCGGRMRLGAGEFQREVAPVLKPAAGAAGAAGDRLWLDAALLATPERQYEWRRLPFASRLVLGLEAEPQSGRQIFAEARSQAHEILRLLIGKILATGMRTQIGPFPDTETEFDAIVAQLRALDGDDLDARLEIGGFADHPIDGDDGPMRCQECIYFLPKRRWCDLPELPLPVEPQWYCRLWKL